MAGDFAARPSSSAGVPRLEQLEDLADHRDAWVRANARIGKRRLGEVRERRFELVALHAAVGQRTRLVNLGEQLVHAGEQPLAPILLGAAAETEDPPDLARTSRARCRRSSRAPA